MTSMRGQVCNERYSIAGVRGRTTSVNSITKPLLPRNSDMKDSEGQMAFACYCSIRFSGPDENSP